MENRPGMTIDTEMLVIGGFAHYWFNCTSWLIAESRLACFLVIFFHFSAFMWNFLKSTTLLAERSSVWCNYVSVFLCNPLVAEAILYDSITMVAFFDLAGFSLSLSNAPEVQVDILFYTEVIDFVRAEISLNGNEMLH